MTNNNEQKPEDQRSIVKNPNNPQHDKDKVNTDKQVKENQVKKKK